MSSLYVECSAGTVTLNVLLLFVDSDSSCEDRSLYFLRFLEKPHLFLLCGKTYIEIRLGIFILKQVMEICLQASSVGAVRKHAKKAKQERNVKKVVGKVL